MEIFSDASRMISSLVVVVVGFFSQIKSMNVSIIHVSRGQDRRRSCMVRFLRSARNNIVRTKIADFIIAFFSRAVFLINHHGERHERRGPTSISKTTTTYII
eukprot:scaffold15497_cov117-Cylindrotheca_fusiformis.AAC.6